MLKNINQDKLILFRPVMDYIREKCSSLYVHNRNLSLDEGMMKWKGRLSIRVYNPKKPCKYGVKFYFLCEAESGYVLDFHLYNGVHTSLRDLVFNLMSSYLNNGYHVFMDNFYNSVGLTEELYQNGVHCSGTLRLARGAPKTIQRLKVRGLDRGETVYMRKENTFVICWQDKVHQLRNKLLQCRHGRV